MGIFSNLFGNNKNNDKNEKAPCKTQQELLECYGAIALEKQLPFYNDVVQDRGWGVDMDRGTITFGDDYEFPMQILGTFSFSSQTWLWAWANEASQIPKNLLKDSLELKKYGEKHQIPFLTSSTFDFSEDELHQIGLIASGMFDADAYYLADYGQGVMVITMTSETIKSHQKNTVAQVLTNFPQFISYFEVNHKKAFCSYLDFKGFEWKQEDNEITTTQGKNSIKAVFDEQSRLVDLKGNLSE